MKVKQLLLVLLLLSSLANAQKGPKEFGDVSLEEIELSRYDKDTTAAAIILFEKGSLEVDQFSNIGYELKTHFRIKILKQSAIKEWGEIKFIFPKNSIRDIKGASYNIENREIIKSELDQNSVFKTRNNKDTDEISFALPNVKEGSVIEYAFTIKYGRLYLPKWQFQNTIPTLWSEYSFFYSVANIVPRLRGPFEIIQEETKYEGKFQKWVLKDIPAFKFEPLMPDEDAYLAAIEFHTEKRTWEKVFYNLMYHADFGGIVYNARCFYLKKDVEAITEGLTEPREKIKAISDYIKQNVKWNGVHDYFADEPRWVFKKKEGTSGDINLILASMLEKAGFEVKLVLLSTRNHGMILEDYPWHGSFNYVICELTLPGERLLLDATEKYLPYDVLPSRCLNHKGFLVSGKEYGWIGMEPKQHEKISLEADIILNEAGEIQGEVQLVMSEYAAYMFRDKALDTRKNEENYVNEVLKGIGAIKLLDQQNPQELEKPVVEKYKLDYSPYATVSSNLLYFNPHIFLREKENPFKMQERLYPVDFEFLEEKVVITKIKIPEGFTVEELPESAVFALPGNAVKFICSISHSENQIMVMNMLQVNKSLFQPLEYLELKELYDKMIEKQSENVVLRKK